MNRQLRQDDHDFENDDPNILRDGERMRVPMSMANSMSRDIAEHFARQRAQLAARDSPAFRRPARGPLVTDQFGGMAGLHKPGPRLESGGNRSDQLVRDGARAEIQRAHDEYRQELENAWRGPLSGDGQHRQQQRDQGGGDPYQAYDAWIEQQWRVP